MSIKIENLSHIYSPDTPFEYKALNNVSCEIEDGEFIGLIGHTGSGKSTLIQHLNGLMTPSSGTVYGSGEDIFDSSKEDLYKLRLKIGIVFQYPESQLFEETVFKDVAFGPKNLGLSEEEIEERVKESLEAVGLDYETFKDKSPFELSGGQMRRVAIAGVVAMRPEVLILDEPTAGLDPAGREEILSQIKKLHEEKGNTIILVSHSMEDVGRLVDKVLVMNKGEIAYFDTPENVFTHTEELEKIGLAAPQITYLMKELKKKYPNINDKIFTIEEAREEIKRVVSEE